MDDWDKYIAKRESGEEDDNFLKKIENLLTFKIVNSLNLHFQK